MRTRYCHCPAHSQTQLFCCSITVLFQSWSGDLYIVKTPSVRVEVNKKTLTATVYDTARTPELKLTTISYLNLDKALKTITLTKEWAEDIFGLGNRYTVSFILRPFSVNSWRTVDSTIFCLFPTLFTL